MHNVDQEYNELVEYVINNGTLKKNRTGVDTLSVFGYQYRVDVSKESFPLLTSKHINFDHIIWELLWYLSGEDHIRNLRERVKYWDDWSDEEGNLETAYGRYWRKYPIAQNHSMGSYLEESVDETKKREKFIIPEMFGEDTVPYFDQLKFVINELKRNPTSRRLIVLAWYPPNALVSGLPPCHYGFQLNSDGEYLDLMLNQRSCDIALGVPYNIANYALMLLLIANESKLKPRHFIHSMGDAHIYVNHLQNLRDQIKREILTPPSVEIPEVNICDLNYTDFHSFKLNNYKNHGPVKYRVAV